MVICVERVIVQIYETKLKNKNIAKFTILKALSVSKIKNCSSLKYFFVILIKSRDKYEINKIITKYVLNAILYILTFKKIILKFARILN